MTKAGTTRINVLDTIRGVAILGILLMNVTVFAFDISGLYNIASQGNASALDWAVGVLGRVFVDQKFMGVFSLLFGTSVALFAERAEQKGEAAVRLSLWRNALLLMFGTAHLLLWNGDILACYAICAPFVIFARKQPPLRLLVLGGALFSMVPLAAALAQITVGPEGAELGEMWTQGAGVEDITVPVLVFLAIDSVCRSLGLMLIGLAFYRLGVVTGSCSDQWYRRAAGIGLIVGLPFAAASVALCFARDFSPEIALVSMIPNTIATIPVVIAYISLIILFERRDETGLHRRLRAVGRMALTNYFTQTLLGLVVLQVVLDGPYTRTGLLVFVAAVWTLQLWWSPLWLERFRYGPFEWAWRCATYGRWVPNRRQPAQDG